MSNLWKLVVVAAVLPLSGCGGSGSDAFCQILGTSGEVRSVSTGVQVDQEALAFDDSLATAAQLYSISGAGTAEFGIQGGTTSASVAGILLRIPAGQVAQVSITALENGAVVSAGNAGTQSQGSQAACPGTCQQREGKTFFGISVSGTYDEIRATVQISGTTESTGVYALCTQG